MLTENSNSTIINFFKKYGRCTRNGRLFPLLVCNDGFSMSVQASSYHSCEPMEDGLLEYKEVEVHSGEEHVDDLLWKYCNESDESTFKFVPIEDVDSVINNHGGINFKEVDRIIEERANKGGII